MDELKTINCEQLMTTPLKPIEFCIDGMLSTGLFILAGAAKRVCTTVGGYASVER